MPFGPSVARVGASFAAMLALLPVTVMNSLAQTKDKDWVVRGEAIVTCPCKTPCPCRSNAPPSQPHCENLSYVHVVEGRYRAVKLDGLKYLWAANECTGKNHTLKPTTLYFPLAASRRQIEGVERIMNSGACDGETPAAVKAKRVPLVAGANGSHYFARVPSTIRLDVDLAPGPIPMEPLPALDLWGNTVNYARNITAKIDDADAALQWDFSGLQSNYRTFEARSEFVAQGLLLALFRDDTGRFNEMHRSLIHELHLEIPLGREDFQNMLAQARAPAQNAHERMNEDLHGAIGGQVLDAEGKPRSGARIHLRPDRSGFEQVTITNPLGRYFFSHVPVGTYQLCASTWDGSTASKGCELGGVAAGQVLSRDLHLTIVKP